LMTSPADKSIDQLRSSSDRDLTLSQRYG
jgi:hypothetical protein